MELFQIYLILSISFLVSLTVHTDIEDRELKDVLEEFEDKDEFIIHRQRRAADELTDGSGSGDVDACVSNPCDNGATCVDNNGIFNCTCAIGFTGETCDQECFGNTHGYNCSESCDCNTTNAQNPNQSCHPVTGVCICTHGWQGTQCETDVNECSNETLYSCPQNSTCSNYDGGYDCACDEGFYESGGVCVECSGNTYGLNCSGSCDCNTTNADDPDQSCHKVSGVCICTLGWQGTRCETDIDECSNGTLYSCPENSTCLNMDGGYDCVCDAGLYESGGICVACPENTYGINCSASCDCNTTNADNPDQSCHPVTGVCICKSHWQGTRCETDVNECSDETMYSCPENSTCTNFDGGYVCVCDVGFYQSGNLCVECSDNMYGVNCSESCDCNTANTGDPDQSCHPISGDCICKSGWEGARCEIDINECSNESLYTCPENSTCSNFDGGYDCVCDAGFNESGIVCVECSGHTWGFNCSDFCDCNTTNTDNSVQSCDPITGNCNCIPEWQGARCETDVDECNEAMSICPVNSVCLNYAGGFDCVCDDGFYESGVVCVECFGNTYGSNCSDSCDCNTTNADHPDQSCHPVTGDCICKSGWEGARCETDIDECSNETLYICPENSTCTNFDGGYVCVCDVGFYESGSICVECFGNTYGSNCSESCDCNTTNADNPDQSCHQVTGVCICKAGWQGPRCETDIDECSDETLYICPDNSTCNNDDGGYVCVCDEGFYQSGSICTECSGHTWGFNCSIFCDCNTTNTDNPVQSCDPVTGDCICRPEWQGARCETDVDECNETISICPVHSFCLNYGGGFDCVCDDGFYESGVVCVECSENNHGFNCSESCDCNTTNADNPAQSCHPVTGDCICRSGWQGTGCETDIDECSNETLHQCQDNSTCMNFDGGFDCICHEGLNEFAGVCYACFNNTYGSNCSESCDCNTTNTDNQDQSCHPVTGDCICKSGWQGTQCETDVDECSNETLYSCPENSTCNNYDGGYDCVCDEGFYESDGVCVECSGNTHGFNCSESCDCNTTNADNPNQSCHPVTGVCICTRGWQGTRCETDIDECSNETLYSCPDNSTCSNYGGGYDCVCDEGFHESDGVCVVCSGNTYGFNCSVSCDCSTTNADNSDQSCHPFTGDCICKSGWQGARCENDIDECSNETLYTCPSNSTCFNLDGGYDCVCNAGFFESGDACVECSGNTYGVNCSESCDCNTTNADNPDQSCQPVTGDCICKSGWEGTRCETDVDECSNETLYSCPENSTCSNFDGGYDCVCDAGFYESGDDCLVCTDNKFGTNCSNSCDCNTTNVRQLEQYCHPVDGTCFCNSEWTGTTCDTDVDECNAGSSICAHKPNSVCLNAPGSYECQCNGNKGFKEDSFKQCVYDLLPYGDEEGDTTAPRSDDNVVAEVSFPSHCAVGARLYGTAFISPNGLISFSSRYTQYTPTNLRTTGSSDFIERVIIAPFYTDIITSYGTIGAIYYHLYTELASENNQQSEKAVRVALEILQDTLGVTAFPVKTMLLVTWNRVTQYINRNTRASFQTAILTDGKLSYAIFFYGSDQIEYTYSDIFIGFTTGSYSLYRQHLASFSNDALNMDKIPNSNGIKGAVAYALNTGPVPNYIQECKDLHQKYQPVFSAVWRLPTCPCFGEFVRFDRRFSSRFTYGRSQNTECTTSFPSARYGHYGMECCYTNWGFWRGPLVRQQSEAGGLLLYHTYDNRHAVADTYMRDVCCDKADRCDLYFDIHPVFGCYNVFPFFIVLIWGDPHIETLDKKVYTFNGHGEYILLKIDTAFVLQARTERAIQKDGNQSDATIFSAFAARDEHGASLHVELNATKDGMVIYGNDDDSTGDFNNRSTDFEKQFTAEINGSQQTILLLSRDTNDSLVAQFSYSEISLKISVGVGMLAISPSVPTEYKNKTTGLLGNFDGDPDNDLIFPNGTFIPGNSTDRQIFHWGQTWAISQSESVLKYLNQKVYDDFNNRTFVPFFLDEADNATLEEAKTKCAGADGSENRQCIYDYAATGRDDVARNTKQSEDEVAAEQTETGNEVPTISGEADRTANVGENVVFTVTAQDDGDVGDITYVLLENSTSVLLSEMGTDGSVNVSLTITEADPVDVRVTAQDSSGLQAEPVVLNLTLCTGCNNHGNCSYTEARPDSTATDFFRFALCLCDNYTTGYNCGDNFDACAENPCSLGRNCTDHSITDHMDTGLAYTCTDCPAGYFDNDVKCEDIDECNGTSGSCSHECTNTEGSFICSCPEGYRLIDPLTCQDIDECEESISDCSHICTNGPGNFTCSCNEGYILDSDGAGCSRDLTVANCSKTTCDQGCSIVNGSDTCFCNIGFELLDADTCTDIDECDQNLCSQSCINTEGSYSCSCEAGYMLGADKTSCNLCASPAWGPSCSKTCVVNENVDSCNPFRGTVCRTGWTGDDCLTNVDECAANASICGDVYKRCTDLNGTYSCPCISGFVLSSEDGSCQDNDECEDPDINVCSQICNNAFGGFSCSCDAGFAQDTENTALCNDIDECESELSGCSQVCENTRGSFNCFCHFGYELQADRKTCYEVGDPCSLFSQLDCSHTCIVNRTAETATCGCGPGYVLGTDASTCINVDECENSALNMCTQNCVDTIGGYTCSCTTGFKLQNDDRTCKVCDEFHYGDNCGQECNCGPGSSQCDPADGCICTPGWTGTRCASDKDECVDAATLCSGENSACVNTPGSYQCVCEPGFEKSSGNDDCQDIDECSNINLNMCDQLCNNTVGSYQCSCRQGFLQSGVSCSDIDECTGVNDCDQGCINTVGGYKCTCDAGFKLNSTNRNTCEPLQECIAMQNTECSNANATCAILEGDAKCICVKGYEYANESDDKSCKDTDECLTNPCSENGMCQNDLGAFSCQCNIGYLLDADGTTCKECPEGRYGTNCDEICSCSDVGTVTCSHTDGTCECSRGWNGTDCSNNINECNLVPAGCADVPHSTCNDLNGTFECDCDQGYSSTANGQCEECDDRHFGVQCKEDCLCIFTNTERCKKADGFCDCKPGWTGLRCHEDEDECTPSTQYCTSDHMLCNNTDGSYFCSCQEGYRLDSTTMSCMDIDECIEGKPCSFICTNEDGGYTCSCPDKGYTGSVNDCTECTGSTYGPQCNMTCNCNTSNSADPNQSCDKETGQCICNSFWTGHTCDSDVNECDDDTLFSCPDTFQCENNVPEFSCVCGVGFGLAESGQCEVCTENTYGYNCSQSCHCNNSHSLNEDQSCDVNNGTCLCSPQWTGTTCDTDYDECNDSAQYDCPDNAHCVNHIGTYMCECDVGYNGTNCQACTNNKFGSKCEEICDCPLPKIKNTVLACDHVTGECDCIDQWQGPKCETDVDECSLATDPCSTTGNSSCHNTEGDFECRCNVGFEKQNDVCIEVCSGNTYGDACNETCNCNATNAFDPTHTCDTSNGNCVCNDQWTGVTCNDDVNECQDVTMFDCQQNSTCRNINGDYTCDCDMGFVLSGEGDTCIACSNNTYGVNCEGNCTCNATNSLDANQTCDHVSGMCICNAMWEGSTCDDDKNECLQADICVEDDNSGCYNEIGGYQCLCLVGYTRNTTLGECVVDTDASVVVPVNAGERKYDLLISLDVDLQLGENLDVSLTNIKYKNEIEPQLQDYFLTEFGPVVFNRLLVISVSFGSIIVRFSVVTSDLDSVPALLARASVDLARGTKVLQLGGSDAPVLNISIGNTQIPVGDDVTLERQLCLAYEETNPCEQNYECVASGTEVSCQLKKTDDNFELVIGLGIGIPLFFICALVVAVLVVYLVKRRKKEKGWLTDRTSIQEGFFPSVPTRGMSSWGRHQGPFYGPNLWDERSSDSSSEVKDDRKPARQQLSDFDSGYQGQHTQPGDRIESNFSWDFVFDYVNPNEKFKIRRPQIVEHPNQAFTHK